MNYIALYLLLNLLLIVFSKAPLAMAMSGTGRYNNTDPRQQQSELDGWGKRALAAHQNALEAIPIFGLALLGAVVLEVDMQTIHVCSIGFFACRLGYQVCYLKDLATLRSIFWLVGLGLCLALPIAAL